MAGALERGDVRLYPFEPPDKQRPVVILTRQSSLDGLSAIAVAPVTPSIRGVPSEVLLDEADGMKAPCVVTLHNVATVRKTRIGRRVAHLGEDRMKEICRALHFALGC